MIVNLFFHWNLVQNQDKIRCKINVFLDIDFGVSFCRFWSHAGVQNGLKIGEKWMKNQCQNWCPKKDAILTVLEGGARSGTPRPKARGEGRERSKPSPEGKRRKKYDPSKPSSRAGGISLGNHKESLRNHTDSLRNLSKCKFEPGQIINFGANSIGWGFIH